MAYGNRNSHASRRDAQLWFVRIGYPGVHHIRHARCLIEPDNSYTIWSPDVAFEAAATLLQALAIADSNRTSAADMNESLSLLSDAIRSLDEEVRKFRVKA